MDLPTVVATGNQAASGVPEVKTRRIEFAIESLAVLARGETMPREINLDSGYYRLFEQPGVIQAVAARPVS